MRWLVGLLSFAALAYVTFGVVLFLFQERLVFLPHVPGRSIDTTPSAIGASWEDIAIETADGPVLHGWRVDTDGPPRGTLLFFHGNAGNIAHRLSSIEIFRDLGLEVVIFDYRGYGRSEGRPSEAGLHRDAEAAVQWILEEHRVRPENLVLFGRSLGGPLAAHAAGRTSPGGLILESTFTSAPDLAGDLYPIYPVRLLTRLRFDTLDALAAVEAPTLVVHSPDDEIVPFHHAERLRERSGGRLLQLSGDHNSGFLQSIDTYRSGLDRFLDEALQPAADTIN